MDLKTYKKAMHVLNLLSAKVDEAIQKLDAIKAEEEGLGKEGIGFARSNDGYGLRKPNA